MDPNKIREIQAKILKLDAEVRRLKGERQQSETKSARLGNLKVQYGRDADRQHEIAVHETHQANEDARNHRNVLAMIHRGNVLNARLSMEDAQRRIAQINRDIANEADFLKKLDNHILHLSKEVNQLQASISR